MNNDSAIDILLKMFEESYALAKQAEEQRATMSNYLITVSAVLFAFVTQQGFTPNVIPISILIVFLGIFGLFMSAKYAQHYNRHYSRSKLIKNRLSELCPETQLQEIEKEALNKNQQKFPFMARRMPILSIWLALHSAICFIGILSIAIAIF